MVFMYKEDYGKCRRDSDKFYDNNLVRDYGIIEDYEKCKKICDANIDNQCVAFHYYHHCFIYQKDPKS